MGPIFKRVILMTCLIFFMGCGATGQQNMILKKYPEYADYIKRNTKYYCMINVAIFQGVTGKDEDEFIIEDNSTYATGLLDTCIKKLRSKHYVISDRHITSVDTKNVINGRVPNPNDLREFYDAVSKYKKSDRNPITGIKNLDPEDGSTAVVVSVMGRSVPVLKQFGQTILSTVKTFGLLTEKEVSYAEIKLHIINSSTGEVVWDDLEEIQGAYNNSLVLNQRVLSSMLVRIIERLPDRKM